MHVTSYHMGNECTERVKFAVEKALELLLK